MKHVKHINEEFQDVDMGLNLFDILRQAENPKNPEFEKIKEIAKKGNLYKYLTTGQRKLTFGMLKSLHQDALKFKKDREIRQGIQKFLWRAIPIALAPIFFPIWLISQVLGATRALNKVMAQVLKMDNGKYDGFITNIVMKTMELTEGEIERLTVDDWFYRSFAIERGLINMVKKEHMIDFGFYISKKIEYQDDLSVVPPYYVENEFRKWCNRKFRFYPPLEMKKKSYRRDI